MAHTEDAPDVRSMARNALRKSAVCRRVLGPDPDGAWGAAWLVERQAKAHHDPARGPFKSYMQSVIRNELQNEAGQNAYPVHVPKNVRCQMIRGEDVPLAVKRAMSEMILPSDAVFTDDAAAEYGEDEIAQAIDSLILLDGRTRQIVKEYFGIGVPAKSMIDIAAEMRITRQAVHHAIKNALTELREHLMREVS